MTLLGAAVGISIYVATTAITNNLERETRQSFENYNTDLAIQSKGSATFLHSRLKPEDLDGLSAILGGNVDPLVVGAFKEEWNPYALLVGVPPRVITRFGLTEGRYPAPGSTDVMVGNLLAQRLGLKEGDQISLGAEPAKVVGVYCFGNRLFDGAVVADISEAQRRTGRPGQFNLALGRLRDSSSLKNVINEINARFPHLTALSTVDFVGNIRLFRTVDTFAKAIAVISFFGSCLVVTNTLLMAVSERTREVGILMAIGWRARLILGMLTAETLTICLGGALVGNGLALLILRMLNSSRYIGLGWIPVTISAEIFLTSLVVAACLALVSIVWPAVILVRMAPVDAIRYE